MPKISERNKDLDLKAGYAEKYGFHDEEWKMIGGAADASSALIASEPLTRDISTWVEVPEYSILWVHREDGRTRVQIEDLDV